VVVVVAAVVVVVAAVVVVVAAVVVVVAAVVVVVAAVVVVVAGVVVLVFGRDVVVPEVGAVVAEVPPVVSVGPGAGVAPVAEDGLVEAAWFELPGAAEDGDAPGVVERVGFFFCDWATSLRNRAITEFAWGFVVAVTVPLAAVVVGDDAVTTGRAGNATAGLGPAVVDVGAARGWFFEELPPMSANERPINARTPTKERPIMTLRMNSREAMGPGVTWLEESVRG
jgi:hypothetical protein